MVECLPRMYKTSCLILGPEGEGQRQREKETIYIQFVTFCLPYLQIFQVNFEIHISLYPARLEQKEKFQKLYNI